MKHIHILLAEDNEGDILLITEAFEESENLSLSVVTNGEDAIDFLNIQDIHKHNKMPDMLILDINMPKKNGHEVLKYVKENENLKHIPVIMFSTSSSQKDINMAYQNHVNCFITKPIDVNDFIKVVAAIEMFWFSIVMLPTNKAYYDKEYKML